MWRKTTQLGMNRWRKKARNRQYLAFGLKSFITWKSYSLILVACLARHSASSLPYVLVHCSLGKKLFSETLLLVLCMFTIYQQTQGNFTIRSVNISAIFWFLLCDWLNHVIFLKPSEWQIDLLDFQNIYRVICSCKLFPTKNTTLILCHFYFWFCWCT